MGGSWDHQYKIPLVIAPSVGYSYTFVEGERVPGIDQCIQ